jgi:hypothetical protein
VDLGYMALRRVSEALSRAGAVAVAGVTGPVGVVAAGVVVPLPPLPWAKREIESARLRAQVRGSI